MHMNLGVLQQYSQPSKFTGFERSSGSQTPLQQNNQQPQEDYGNAYAFINPVKSLLCLNYSSIIRNINHEMCKRH